MIETLEIWLLIEVLEHHLIVNARQFSLMTSINFAHAECLEV